jgi:riboflavin kinase/FMN adenylyltransferase
MTVIEWPDFLKNGLPLGEKLSSVTVGVFDGVHRGHQALIERVVSHNSSFVPVVITFRQNHKGEKNTGDIQTFQQRTAMFESLGLKIAVVVDFTESFRHMPGIEFLELLLKHGNIGFLAVGSNFRCGYGLDTDAAAIQKFFALQGIPVEIVPEVMEGSLPISSSRIRSAILRGDLLQAQAMLGRPYTIDF